MFFKNMESRKKVMSMKIVSESDDYYKAAKLTVKAFLKFLGTDLKDGFDAENKLFNSDESSIIELYRYSVCKALRLSSVLNYSSLDGVVDAATKVIENEIRNLDLSTEDKRKGFLSACVHTINFIAEKSFFDKTGRR